jgi:hypothetical protein
MVRASSYTQACDVSGVHFQVKKLGLEQVLMKKYADAKSFFIHAGK